MGKTPPANPSSPSTPKKSSKVNASEKHTKYFFKVGGVVSNGLSHGKSAAAAILGKGSNNGGKMSPAAQKMSTIASTVASLQVVPYHPNMQQILSRF